MFGIQSVTIGNPSFPWKIQKKEEGRELRSFIFEYIFVYVLAVYTKFVSLRRSVNRVASKSEIKRNLDLPYSLRSV